MPRTFIAYIDLRFFAHATEDVKKVVEAVQHILPTCYLDNISFEKQNLRGHHGNPINFFKTRIKKREIIEAFIKNLSSRLDGLEKETLFREINLHIVKGSLYIRLDKQAAFKGELKLYAVDPIHVRIRFRKNKIEDIIQICHERGIIPTNT